MHYSLLIVSCCCCLLLSAASAAGTLRALGRQAETGVMTAVRSQLVKLDSGLPGGVVCPWCLIVGPQTSSHVVQGAVERSQLQASVRSRGLPREVADRLETLAFARSVVFQSFSFVVSALVGRGHYETFVGAGRRLGEGNMVEFGVVRSVASAQLVTKTTPVNRRNCKRRFFIKRCRSWTDQVPRGLTAEELRLVEAALRHFAVASASQSLAGVRHRSRRSADADTDVADTDNDVVDTDVADTDVADTDNDVVDKAVADITTAPTPMSPTPMSPTETGATVSTTAATLDIGGNRNESLAELVRSGFDHLALVSSTQLLRRVRVASVGAFAAVFARSMRVPPDVAGPLRNALIDAVRAGDEGRWRGFSALFTADTDPASIHFVRVSLRRRGDSFDLAAASVRLAVRFADRLQLVRADGDGDEIRLRRLPASVTDDDLRRALRLLEAAAGRAFGSRLSGMDF